MMHAYLFLCSTQDCRCRWYFGGSPCRRLGSQKNCHQSYKYPACNSGYAYCKYRHSGKLTTNPISQNCAQTTAGDNSKKHSCRNSKFTPIQCLQTNKPHDLLTTSTNTAHHSKKLYSLADIAIHASRNHQYTSQKYKNKQNSRYTIHIFHRFISAGT